MLKARAHSKVNLHLGVGPARADGFHELRTIFQSLSLFDALRLEPHSASQHVITVSGLGADTVPTDSRNLVWRAVDRVVELAGEQRRFRLHLDKGIPTAGGMAGGSADAAAALLLANKELGEPLSEAQLLDIAAELGSDIPFTLLGGTMLGTGRGEKLTPVPSQGEYHWALAFNAKGLSTPAVFRKLDEMRASPSDNEPSVNTQELEAALAAGNIRDVARLMANDLEAPALELLPELQHTLARGEQAGALRGMVSGSGPTCAFLCESAEAATYVARDIEAAGLATGTDTATGPAAGAHVTE
ncbi:4-(cytidine 5'-diphospho)-2-C-methyl-D-erythritol kinase [Staphylococcus chromogenes]|nr:4-(cytidine 5'-diphospho)-2-C-methyl-D-erythritol kinase [Staphylococcus chromogenes]